MEKIHPAFRESLEEAEEELFLLCCALRCMMEEERSRELESLRRLTDYLRQHLGDLRSLGIRG